jgi:hypothetical protein
MLTRVGWFSSSALQVQECYELSAEYETDREEARIAELGAKLTSLCKPSRLFNFWFPVIGVGIAAVIVTVLTGQSISIRFICRCLYLIVF